MPRFLHTADWQIGRRYSQFDPDDAALLAEARTLVVEKIAALATDRAVDAVLVAGDVFDAQTVGDRVIRRLFAATSGFAGARRPPRSLARRSMTSAPVQKTLGSMAGLGPACCARASGEQRGLAQVYLRLCDKMLGAVVHLVLVAVAQPLEDKVENEWVSPAGVEYLALQGTRLFVQLDLGRVRKRVLPHALQTLAQTLQRCNNWRR